MKYTIKVTVTDEDGSEIERRYVLEETEAKNLEWSYPINDIITSLETKNEISR